DKRVLVDRSIRCFSRSPGQAAACTEPTLALRINAATSTDIVKWHFVTSASAKGTLTLDAIPDPAIGQKVLMPDIAEAQLKAGLTARYSSLRRAGILKPGQPLRQGRQPCGSESRGRPRPSDWGKSVCPIAPTH